MGNFPSSQEELITILNTRSIQTPPPPLRDPVNVENEYISMEDQLLHNCVVALYDYESPLDTKLNFKKGDIMQLIDESTEYWWYVRKDKDGTMCYVPRNYVARCNTLEAEEWFFGKISRIEAEHFVSGRNLPIGTFLIRERETNPPEYVLTMKSNNRPQNYRIKRLDRDEGFYISSKHTFSSLNKLIHYYKNRRSKLCSKLAAPAPKTAPDKRNQNGDVEGKWEITRNQLELKDKLSSGDFGEVWKCTWKAAIDVVVKIRRMCAVSSEEFLKGTEIMEQCDHPNIVRIYAVYTREEPSCIILECLENGSLLSYVRNEENQMSREAMINISGQIANAMRYLEKEKIIHRDLAARNILVGGNIDGIPIVKLTNFGLASKITKESIYEAQIEFRFSLKWIASEAAVYEKFTAGTDQWSFGILLWEIFSRGQEPYAEWNQRDIFEKIGNGDRMSKPDRCPQDVYCDVILKCWERDPDKRPIFSTLFSYFDDYYITSQDNCTFLDDNAD
ncbi:hypothetical protein FO519_009432 [Halicephalobus sp. NKZ332]|nr:hypothetical protein FO519_009432 [Halicephalobus sp. NKZ332]